MTKIKIKFPFYLGITITLLYLAVNLMVINHYGVTWDYTYHFNAGLWHLHLPQTDPGFIMGPSPPLSDTLPVVSYEIFSRLFHLLPWDSAYNLYSVILGSLGIGLLYFMVKRLLNWQIALFSAISLALLPRYFGHLHNNMKDIPQAVFFTLAIFSFWLFYKKTNWKTLLFSTFTVALSFNSKVNAIFIPIIAFSFLFCVFVRDRYYGKFSLKPKIKMVILYFILSPVFSFIVWAPFWPHPVSRLIEASHSYTTSTMNMPILYFSDIVFSGQNVPWHYPFGILAVTTPVVMLIFSLIGLLTILSWNKIRFEEKVFILLWFVIPVSRYFKPHMIVIDDIRHFMEVIFPFAALSGLGVYSFFYFVTNKLKNKITIKNKMSIFICLSLIYFAYLSYQIITYHPYETSYFGELIGGIQKASHKFDIEFWASAYKHAMGYINKNAPKNARIIIPMAPDIAKLYLRDDLTAKLNTANMAGAQSYLYSQSDYTVVLNRESFFSWYGIYPYIQTHKPIYTLSVQNVPLVSIYKN